MAFYQLGLSFNLNTQFSALPYSFRSKRIPSGLTSLTAEFGKGSGVPLSLEAPKTAHSNYFLFSKSLDHRREKQERGDREHDHGKHGKCQCKTFSIIIHNYIIP